MCEVLDRIENRGIEKGIIQGMEKGIEVLILDNIEESFDKERIIAKLIKHFGLNETAAETYYEKYAFQAL